MMEGMVKIKFVNILIWVLIKYQNYDNSWIMDKKNYPHFYDFHGINILFFSFLNYQQFWYKSSPHNATYIDNSYC